MVITEEIQKILKKPFGFLIQDTEVSKEIINEHILKSNRFVVSVGDTTTNKLLSFNIIPNIAIVDGKERRIATNILKISEKILNFKNNNFSHYLNDKENKNNNTSDQFFKTSLEFSEMHCVNPAGSISRNAVSIISDAIDKKIMTHIIVEGEEDLLALPVFALSPEGTIVFYGQPFEGLVVVHVDKKIKKIADELMEKIGIS